jgi:hypothetical protein
MDIRIQAPTEEKFQEVLEAIRPIGVEVITGDDNPLVTALFYLSRINSKLDNLGQLRHLHKVLGHLGSIAQKAEAFDKREQIRYNAHYKYNDWLYNRLAEKTGKDPIRDAVGLDRARLAFGDGFGFLTSDEIRAMFEFEKP